MFRGSVPCLWILGINNGLALSILPHGASGQLLLEVSTRPDRPLRHSQPARLDPQRTTCCLHREYLLDMTTPPSSGAPHLLFTVQNAKPGPLPAVPQRYPSPPQKS